MLLTEVDAQKLWCPFARVVSMDGNGRIPEGQAAYNRVGIDLTVGAECGACAASRCMAWRRGPLEEATADDPDAVTGREAGADARYVELDGKRRFKPRRGYCGLAGQPFELLVRE